MDLYVEYLLSEDCNYFNIEWQVLAPSAGYVEPGFFLELILI